MRRDPTCDSNRWVRTELPPFGTCFRGNVGPGYALQAAARSITGGLSAGPGSLRSGPHCARSRRCAPPVAVISFGLRVHGRNGGNNDMEGPAERRLFVGPAARTSLPHVASTSFEFCRSAPGVI